MTIKTAGKRIFALWITICMLVSSLSTVSAMGDYPDAKLIFSGFTLSYGQNGKIQAAVDVEIEKIYAVGTYFELKYDSSVIVPSDYETNEELKDTSRLEDQRMFKQNTDVFPTDVDDTGNPVNYLGFEFDEFFTEVIDDQQKLTMMLFPQPDTPESDYITTETSEGFDGGTDRKVIKADGRVKLGSISFNVVDPKKLCNATEEELKEILYVDTSTDGPYIMYIDSDKELNFNEIADYEWKVSRTLLEAVPAVPKRTVSAYSLYGQCRDSEKEGTTADLIEYLNRNMNTVVQKYSDGDQELDLITWGPNEQADNGFEITADGTVITDENYNPTGGVTYTVKQNYGDKVIEVKVIVTKVIITGFDYDRRIITFPENARPQTWEDLKMPDEITPIMRGTDDLYAPPVDRPILASDWSPPDTLGALATAEPRVTQTYTHDYDQNLFSPNPAWLTVPEGFSWTVDAIRNIAASGDPPDPDPDEGNDITAEVDRESGVLEIIVGEFGGEMIAEGTDFRIYLPDGTEINSIDNNEFVNVSIFNGEAVITVDTILGTTKTSEELEIIQALINLGSSQTFRLSTVLPDDGSGTRITSASVPFSFDPRINYYLGENGNNYVEKDYSEGRKSMFPVVAGQALSDISTYIEFPDYSTIPIAYHGQSGEQPSELYSAKVIEWKLEGDSSATALPDTVGETVTIVGMLYDNYSYTNFGRVQNPDSVELKIKVTVGAAPTPAPVPTENPSATMNPDATPTPVPGEAIKITTVTANGAVVDLVGKTFEYDKQTVGYSPDNVQEQRYTIENIGSEKITGLSLRISDITGDTDSNPTKYVLSDPLPVRVIDTGETTEFAIRTTCGLPVGKYTARVSVGSLKSSELGGFNISFEVTGSDTYRVTFTPKNTGEDITIGYGYLTNEDGTVIRSNTYSPDETVDIFVEIIDTSYTFKEWENDVGVTINTTSDSGGNDLYDFTMPSSDIVLTPVFEPSISAKIRLSDLIDLNDDNSANDLRSNTKPYGITTFAENKFDYRVVVKDSEKKNYVKFTLKDTAPEGTAITVTANGSSLAYSPAAVSAGSTYTSDRFELKDGINTVTITTSYTDDDGKEYTQAYNLIIIRKGNVNVDIIPGNSPFGLIEASFPGDENKTVREELQRYFSEHHKYDLSDPSKVPKGAASTYDTYYSADAWSGANYDEDPTALFVYSDTVFVDPGFQNLKDMDGNSVSGSDVVREIEPTLLASIGANALDNLDSANKVSPPPKITPGSGEKCVIDLTSYNIRPGIYSIKYSFNDSDGQQRSFSRPLIVLNRKGDVNINKTLGEAEDYETLYERMANGYYDKILQSSEAWAKLYAYRICDVTEDRNVNSIDANAIQNTMPLTEYYEPLPKTLTEVLPEYDSETAVVKPTASEPPEKAVLTLDYMGLSVPEKTARTPNLTNNNVDSVVWIGIGIKNPTKLTYFIERGLYSLDFAIDYDPEIFEPYGNGSNARADIIDDLEYYNFDSLADTTDNVYWTNASLNEDAFVHDKAFDSSGRYKTVFINILSNDGTSLRMKDIASDDKTIYLLRVPFRLVKYPDSSYAGKAVDVRLTEHTFVLGSGETGTEASAGWEGEGKTRTTEANNLFNHLTVEVTDIFDTDGKYNVKGKLTAWNRGLPTLVEMYRVTPASDGTSAGPAISSEPDYTFKWDELDDTGKLKYGSLTENPQGFCTWEYNLPVSNRFSYIMVVKKQSHLTYPDVSIDKDSVSGEALAVKDQIDLIAGDINSDQIIKLPDRAELMRFFNRQKPWDLNKPRFEASDLNGDGAVNLFDLNLLQQNYDRVYAVQASSSNGSGGDSP